MNKGTSRKKRLNKALEAGYFSVDERSALDLLQFTLKYAQFLNFYGSAKGVNTSWDTFLQKDAIFIVASICSTNIHQYKINFYSQSSNPDSEKLNEELKDATNSMINLVETWHMQLSSTNSKGGLLSELQQVINSFEKTQKANTGLKENYENIYGSLVYIQSKATKWFEEELQRTDHHPHIGLILTFLKLYEHAQSDINSLTQKHLDFYFRDLLQQKNKKLANHSAMVSVQLAPGIKQLEIQENEPFEFLVKGEEPIVFYANSQTQVNHSEIADIKTLFKSNYFPFGNNHNGNSFSINNFFQLNILNESDNDESVNLSLSEHLPATLGEAITNDDLFNDDLKMSELGFVVSSPALILEKGKQHITLTFKITPESYIASRTLFDGLVEEETNQLNKKQHDEQKLRQGIISRFFESAFVVSITHETGWKRVETFNAKPDPEKFTLTFDFHLETIEEQLIAYNSELHEGDLTTEWPCFKIILNNNTQYQPYKILKNVIIEDISINANVTEVKELQLSNLLGKLDSTIPMQAFGPAPTVGSYFALHNSRLLQKHLSGLEVIVNWSGLPIIKNGFSSYYSQYPSSIQNSSFKMLVTQNKNDIRNSGKGAQQRSNLFNTKDDYLINKTRLDIQLDLFNFENRHHLQNEDEQNYANPLYFVLVEPEMAFGHQIYPEIYAEAALKSSRHKKLKVELPAQPHTPVIEHLEINYSNSVREMMYRKQDVGDSDIKLFHLHPFGHVQVFPGPVKSQNFLFPQINNTGHLFLGIKNTKPDEIISVGFDLVSAEYKHTVIEVPKVKWQYLLHNEWQSINKNILEDSTNGLTKSGIVKIQIPGVTQTNNTIMPAKLFWLRAVYTSKQHLNSRIKKVFTQAVLLQSTSTIPKSIIQENELQDLQKISSAKLKGIHEITGPFASSYSESTETDDIFNSRISERLRHKNRALTNWDVERLILEKFTQIEKIRVYGRSSHPKELVKNCDMQIVLIPKTTVSNTLNKQNSGVDISTLHDVKKYVAQFVSPHVRIEVSNPVFEYLKVRCSVKFMDVSKSGYYRNILNKALISYLSPGIENEFIEKGFDESISKAEIQNFIESQSYVDFVTQFSVLQLVEVQDEYRIIDTAKIEKIHELRTISPYAILTSAPRHQIDSLESEQLIDPSVSGVGDLSVGLDFIISDSKGKYN